MSPIDSIHELLEKSSAAHTHICPRQVLGVRMGLAGGKSLGLELPIAKKELLVIAETDGCFVDGISAATGAAVGHRTLRIEDYGKIAATFIDPRSGYAVRISPGDDIRRRALLYAPGEERQYFAQLLGYQVMPEQELLNIQEVRLMLPVKEIISRPGVRAICSACGEEIINEREVCSQGQVFCRACYGSAYYEPVGLGVPLAFLVRASQDVGRL
jgi:formylmethanofuran dehydrogenase subunit E